MSVNSSAIALGLCVLGSQMLSSGVVALTSYNTAVNVPKDSNYLFAVAAIVFGAALIMFSAAYALLPSIIPTDQMFVYICFAVMVIASFVYGVFNTIITAKNIATQHNGNVGSNNITVSYIISYAMYAVALAISLYGLFSSKPAAA